MTTDRRYERKLFEASNDGPGIRLGYSSEGHGYANLWVEELADAGWTHTGSIELRPARSPTYRGVCKHNPTITNWSYTEFRATGDRIAVSHRLRVLDDYRGDRGRAVIVGHQTKREQTLGTGRDEHDWRTRETWRITPTEAVHSRGEYEP